MGANSSIEWTDHTFNPWIGCMKVSAGCAHCYAETLDHRWGHDNWGPPATTERRKTSADNWKKPLAWNKTAAATGESKRVFCASMADVFEDHPQVAPWRAELLDLIADTPHLDWLLLTKRPQHVTAMVKAAGHDVLPANVWLGTSVENQQTADERIPYLLEVPATVRFLSCEPLLGPVLFNVCEAEGDAYGDGAIYYNMLTGYRWMRDGIEKELEGTAGIDWVIVGGESGGTKEIRPMHPNWARSIRDQCQRAGVAFFFKQWGDFVPAYGDARDKHGMRLGGGDDPNGRDVIALPDGTITDLEWNGGPGPHLRGGDQLLRLGKKSAGRLLDGRTWDELPRIEVPQ